MQPSVVTTFCIRKILNNPKCSCFETNETKGGEVKKFFISCKEKPIIVSHSIICAFVEIPFLTKDLEKNIA